MKLGKLVKTVIKFAPVIYPIVRKVMAERKGTKTTAHRK